jgi:hypothetical protein
MLLYGTVAPGSAAIRYKTTGEAVVAFTLASETGGLPIEVRVKSARPAGLFRDLADGRAVIVVPASRRICVRRRAADRPGCLSSLDDQA